MNPFIAIGWTLIATLTGYLILSADDRLYAALVAASAWSGGLLTLAIMQQARRLV